MESVNKFVTEKMSVQVHGVDLLVVTRLGMEWVLNIALIM
jgi:hypothetical protein